MDNHKIQYERVKNNRILSGEEVLELVKKIQQGDKESRNRLVLWNLGLVYKIAYSKWQDYPEVAIEDLLQAGSEQLIKSAQYYSLEIQAKFSTYAYKNIGFAIDDEIKLQKQTIKNSSLEPLSIESMAEENTVLGKGLESRDKDPLQTIVEQSESEIVHDEMNCLTKEEQQVLNLLYDSEQQMSYQRIGIILDKSETEIEWMVEDALEKLRNMLWEKK
ncbi:MAG: RNA polymerase sigma factor [Lachnospiraceae bacterium]